MRDEVITDLDRQIQEALAVDPSPEFLARVRIRLAEEPRRYRVGIGWLLSGATGLTVVAVSPCSFQVAMKSARVLLM